ncbi:MAG: hypothetical protein IPG89_13105 [Bacteroidetes bacterium]|nr:hypothetical protein [Bacteroidota bacterium]
MKASEIKKEMYESIEVIEDKEFLKAINLLLNEKTKEYDFDLSDSDKKELDELKKLRKAGKTKSYTVNEVRENAYRRYKK